MDRPEVGIVIPALNEEATIATVVHGVSPYGQAVVVDDGSIDSTGECARRAGALVVRHTSNQGYDGALNSGFAEATRIGCSYLVTFDADGQHHPSLLATFIGHMKSGCGLVIGVREHPARAAEAVFGWYTRLRFGLSDPLCGLKAYHVDVYRELGHFDSYRSIGTELMLYGMRTGKKFTTVPVQIAPRHGEPRFAQRWRANARIFRALVLSFVH